MTLKGFAFPKFRTAKDLFRDICKKSRLKDPWKSNMVNGPKHC